MKATRACESKAVDADRPPGQRPISLCIYTDELRGDTTCFMQWRKAPDGQGLQGQTIVADEHDKVKYSVHTMYPYRARSTWKRLEVLHPDCGVAVEKIPPRPPIPERIVALKRMWDFTICNLDPTSVAIAECEVCGNASIDMANALNRAMTCSICLKTSHEKCCARMLSCVKLDTIDLQPILIPKRFNVDAVLCNLCRLVARRVATLCDKSN